MHSMGERGRVPITVLGHYCNACGQRCVAPRDGTRDRATGSVGWRLTSCSMAENGYWHKE